MVSKSLPPTEAHLSTSNCQKGFCKPSSTINSALTCADTRRISQQEFFGVIFNFCYPLLDKVVGISWSLSRRALSAFLRHRSFIKLLLGSLKGLFFHFHRYFTFIFSRNSTSSMAMNYDS